MDQGHDGPTSEPVRPGVQFGQVKWEGPQEQGVILLEVEEGDLLKEDLRGRLAERGQRTRRFCPRIEVFNAVDRFVGRYAERGGAQRSEQRNYGLLRYREQLTDRHWVRCRTQRAVLDRADPPGIG